MKSKKQIKEELHKLIDSIDDKEVLNVLNEDIVPYMIENKTPPPVNDESELTDEQQRRLEEAIKQAEEDKVITLDEFYSKMEKWRTK